MSSTTNSKFTTPTNTADQDLFPEIASKISIRLRNVPSLGTGINVFDARDETLYGDGSLHWTTGVEHDEIAGGLLWTGGFITGALAHDGDGDHSRPELNATLPQDLAAAGFTDLSVFCGNGEALSTVTMFPAAYALQDLGYDVWIAE